MQQRNSLTFWRYLSSRAALLNIIIPLALYNGALYFSGAGMALLVSAIWAGVLAVLSGDRQATLSVALMILLSGASHYVFLLHPAWLPIQREAVFLALSGALTVTVVFLCYSLRGRPIVRTLAEQAIPTLTTLSVYGTPAYARVWQEVSLAWVTVYLLKAALIYGLYRLTSTWLDAFLLLAGWPLTLAMIFFSFRWPRYRWRAIAKQRNALAGQPDGTESK
ncbi:hypothetical protein CWC46_17655 [Prodigiosinella confusarubida]|uniref:DUF3159 domain-containing protein n=1 Tax=Serratia sp. (strain ATCC 39006) TaxID=104623 RepID=A0A2I5TMK8_SERS3|nr:hypothetical protein [Serratia sp. ATCC 39006]AUH01473.1 hypothetical protein CWC46_17655 [Serratia sp. ATCC 39006]AUH05795.1 hypothetical protein Ser39006_017655 [Serratia sp. ATCC 39006]WJY13816.1 hypothetical protein PCO82_14810 [Pectobacteriaceae bacterium CE90]